MVWVLVATTARSKQRANTVSVCGGDTNMLDSERNKIKWYMRLIWLTKQLQNYTIAFQHKKEEICFSTKEKFLCYMNG